MAPYASLALRSKFKDRFNRHCLAYLPLANRTCRRTCRQYTGECSHPAMCTVRMPVQGERTWIRPARGRECSSGYALRASEYAAHATLIMKHEGFHAIGLFEDSICQGGYYLGIARQCRIMRYTEGVPMGIIYEALLGKFLTK